jgi:Fumarylacetoacetate (FAA) hydrolase family
VHNRFPFVQCTARRGAVQGFEGHECTTTVCHARRPDDKYFTIVQILVDIIILVMGTPSGVGNARNPKIFMKPGDVCEVEIERAGLLRNSVVAEA